PARMQFQRLTRDHSCTQFSEAPFAGTGKMGVEMLGHHQLQYRISQKLQPLIIEMPPLRFVAEARMGQRFRQQKRVAKFILDSLFKWTHAAANVADRPALFQMSAAAAAATLDNNAALR